MVEVNNVPCLDFVANCWFVHCTFVLLMYAYFRTLDSTDTQFHPFFTPFSFRFRSQFPYILIQFRDLNGL